MSYVQSNSFYSNAPSPYVQDDRGAPVPGWGVNPAVAGPRMIAVGQGDESSTTPARAIAFAGLLAALWGAWEVLKHRERLSGLDVRIGG